MIKPADRLKLVGEYYFSKKLQEIAQMRACGINVINLGIGSPDLAPSIETITATAKALGSEKNHGYPTSRGAPELRAAIAEWYLKTYGAQANPESEILPLLGSKEGILYTSLAFLNPGDGVLVPNPGYPAYQGTSLLIGARVVSYDLTESTNWEPDFKKLNSMDLTGVKMMWVNYPNMPTGQPATEELLKKLIQFGKEKSILICHDNPYSLVLNPKPLSILQFDPDKTTAIELNSMSKSFNMAGWRVGMVLGDRKYIDAILQAKSNVDSGMFLPLQQGAIAALKNSDQWHAERNKLYKARRNIVYKILDHLNCKYELDKAGMFVWAKCPPEIKNVESFLNGVLQKAHVFLTPGFIFGTNGERFVRVSLCASEVTLNEALKRIQSHNDWQVEK